MTQSGVARLREQIASDYMAAKLGLTGLASGISRHEFITRKMERMGEAHQQLEALLGRERAVELVAETLQPLPS